MVARAYDDNIVPDLLTTFPVTVGGERRSRTIDGVSDDGPEVEQGDGGAWVGESVAAEDGGVASADEAAAAKL